MSQQYFPSTEDKNVMGRFEIMQVPDNRRSREVDELVTRPITVLREKIAGNKDTSATPVKEENRAKLQKKYPEAWAAFQGEQPEIEGTPLTKIGLNADQIEAANLAGIYVVEQVAELHDAQCNNLGFGWRKRRADAQELLGRPVIPPTAAAGPAPEAAIGDLAPATEFDAAVNAAVNERMADFLATVDDRVEARAREIAAKLAAEAKPKRKPGRPKKVDAAPATEAEAA